MRVRPAQERDITKLLTMCGMLFRYLKTIDETGTLTDDENLLAGSSLTQMVFMMTHPQDNAVLVMEDERSDIRGFLCGRVELYPPYYAHPRVGAVISFYPMSDASGPLWDAFDLWVKERGCTRRMAYLSVKAELGIEAATGEGMVPSCMIMVKDY